MGGKESRRGAGVDDFLFLNVGLTSSKYYREYLIIWRVNRTITFKNL